MFNKIGRLYRSLKIDPTSLLITTAIVFAGIFSGIAGLISVYNAQNMFAPRTSELADRIISVLAFLSVGVVAQALFTLPSILRQRNKEVVVTSNSKQMHVNALLSAVAGIVAVCIFLYVYQTTTSTVAVPINTVLPLLMIAVGDVLVRKLVKIKTLILPFAFVLPGLVLISMKTRSITDIGTLVIVLLSVSAIFSAFREHIDQIGRTTGDTAEYTNTRMFYLAVMGVLFAIVVAILMGRLDQLINIIVDKVLNLQGVTEIIGILLILTQQGLGWAYNHLVTWSKVFRSVTSINIVAASVTSITAFTLGYLLGGSKTDVIGLNGFGLLLLIVGTVFILTRRKTGT